MKAIIQTTYLLILTVGLGGCVIQPPALPDDPSYAPVMAASAAQAQVSNGSLFRDTGGLDFFTDNTARTVGDIITVVLEETTVSRKSSNVDVSKDSDAGMGGADAMLLGQGINLSTNLSAERDFSGQAGANQSNNLRGNIAVTVVEVWPNGTLVVRGEKWLTLNRGDEFIRISGLIRPEDIQANNRVTSTNIANARISYSGTGTLADAQSMGWLSRFFYSPYWPF